MCLSNLPMAQEDVRNWVAKVVIDALKQGASQGLLQELEEAQPGAVAPPSAALSRLLMTMLVHADEQPRATRTYVYRDSNEQMFRILKVRLPCHQGPITDESLQSGTLWPRCHAKGRLVKGARCKALDQGRRA